MAKVKKIYLLIEIPHDEQAIEIAAFAEKKDAVKAKAKRMNEAFKNIDDPVLSEAVHQALLEGRSLYKSRKYEESIKKFEQVYIFSWVDPYRALWIQESKLK